MMFPMLACFSLAATFHDQGPAQQLALKANQTISKSAAVTSRTYRFPNAFVDAKQGALFIKGDNIVVDFQGSTLEGTPPETEPNQRAGTGLVITGRNVTVKNLKIRGYKLGLVAVDSPGLKLYDVDASYNWKQRLLSTLDREDGADWMSYHQNEKDEWLRYGAAFYLRGCDDFEVRNCRAVGGQNGLMITQCNRGLIWNNDFSFLSSLGLGMYRSSDNRIMHNSIDWCVRGFSLGVYNRGQDSAGILIYEQSHRNVFAYNSVTHGGDGFFLWAGQTTMDTGKGGCNDNLLFGNDFSHAPTNGIEATFSRNNFVNNLILECWHGIWGGYSYESKTVANVFGHNAEAIAWEHGQDNLVEHNRFIRDNEGLVIWSNPTQDPNWNYPKNRDTRSRDWTIRNNSFEDTFQTTFRIRRTLNVAIENNTIRNVGRVLNLGDLVEGLTVRNNEITLAKEEPGLEGNKVQISQTATPKPPASSLNQGEFKGVADYLARFESIDWNSGLGGQAPAAAQSFQPKPLQGGRNPFLQKGTLRGWRYMLVDHWGPYDFKSPVIWPRGEIKDNAQMYEILGPKGTATVIETIGCDIDAISTDGGTTWSAGGGRAARIPVPSHVRIRYPQAPSIERKLVMEYRGEAVTDYRGLVTPRGRPFRFGFSHYFLPIDWTVRFFQWNDSTDPRTKPDAFKKLIEAEPVKTEKVNKLNYAGNVPGVSPDRFATVAEGTFEVPAGDYVLNVTTDDGVRVWVNGELVIKDAWKYQGPTPYSANLKLNAGKHTIRVEHFEIDGYSALKVELAKK